jgi:hypothetical protein
MKKKDGDLIDQTNLIKNQTILKPTPAIVEAIKNISNELNRLINFNNLDAHQDYDQISLFLNKSLRYINSAILNENEKHHFASFRCLKSAANNLDNLLNDLVEQSIVIFDSKTAIILKNIINELNLNAEKIDKLHCLDLDNTLEQNHQLAVEEQDRKKTQSESTDEWVLSEFNLKSHDLNGDLHSISEEIFNLDINFQVIKILNKNCLLIRERHNQANKFVLKVKQ